MANTKIPVELSSTPGIVDNSNATAITIDSSENVGIGTSSPSELLHINNTTGTGCFIRFQNTGGSGVYIGGRSEVMEMYTNGSEKMRIDSSGNVGIGTSSITNNTLGKTTYFGNSTSLITGDSSQARFWLGNNWYYNSGDKFIGTGYANLYTQQSGNHEFLTSTASGTAGAAATFTTVLKIDSSGKVSIGTTSAAELFNVAASGTAAAEFAGNNNTLGTTSLFVGQGGGGDAYVYQRANLPLIFATNATERMRILSNGSVFIGTTTEPTGSTGGAGFSTDSSNRKNLILATTGTGTLELIEFRNPNGTVGTIKTSGSSTSYNTSSDGRLKDVTGSARGLEVINELNPVAYNWKADGRADEGLIAQEVLDIVPNAVTGSEEEQYYMDYSKLVVHLVAGMKEQQAQIEALQSEINNLKGE